MTDKPNDFKSFLSTGRLGSVRIRQTHDDLGTAAKHGRIDLNLCRCDQQGCGGAHATLTLYRLPKLSLKLKDLDADILAWQAACSFRVTT